MIVSLTEQKIKQWSRYGPRATYGLVLLEAAGALEDLVAVSADLGNSSGLDRFKQTFPDRFLNVGVAEQNLVGFSAGVSKEGFVVFASSFAPFVTMRACEQVRMNLGYMQNNVKIVGIGSGVSMGFLGNSHFGLEDVSVMRSIAGMTVVSPADCAEIAKVVEAAALVPGPVYIRLTGGPNMPIVYSDDYEYHLGEIHQLEEGKSVALIATGSMVSVALSAATLLRHEGLSVSVFNAHTIKPLDAKKIDEIASNVQLLVSIEEHSVLGGLGSAISEVLSGLAERSPLLRLGLPDEFGESGDYQYLLNVHGLEPIQVARNVMQRFLDLS